MDTLRMLRVRLDLSQSELAEKAEVSINTVIVAEKGRKVSLETAKMLCKALGTSTDQVTGLTISDHLYRRARRKNDRKRAS